MIDWIKKIIEDEELKKEIRGLIERFIFKITEDPLSIDRNFKDFLSEFFNLIDKMSFEIFGVEEPMKQIMNLPKEKKEVASFLENYLSSLEAIVLMLPLKEMDNKFTSSVSTLFELSAKKDPKRLENIFEKSRLGLYRKFVESWKRSWRGVAVSDIPEEAKIDNKITVIKRLSEGIYRPLLVVLQEMMQIVYGYRPTEQFGVILDQMSKKDLTKPFVNMTAYDIRNTESHEDIMRENGNIVRLYNRNNKFYKIEEKELDEIIKWLTNFTNSVFYSLQINYLNFRGIKPEERIEYFITYVLGRLLSCGIVSSWSDPSE